MQNAAGSAGICLDPAEREQLRALMTRHGERTLARGFSLNSQSLSRAAAGLQIRRSTARLIRLGLSEAGESNP